MELLDNKIFALALLIMGVFEIVMTCANSLPLVQQKNKLQESIAQITSPKEKKDAQMRLRTYENMFIVLRVIGVVLVAFGIYGLAT
jgi:hypothetical protein